MTELVHNETIDALLERRSIRRYKNEPIDDNVIATLETVATHAASSQYLNDWSAIRISDKDLQRQIAEICHQDYVGKAPLLYIFIIDEYRNAMIAKNHGVDLDSEDFTLNGGYRFTQAQNDAVLALHAMETAAYSLGLGCVILGSILNDVDKIVELLQLPKYTYPVLGLAIGKPDHTPGMKPRMPLDVQFMENHYETDSDVLEERFARFDHMVQDYYDTREPERAAESFSDQIVTKATQGHVRQIALDHAYKQDFDLDH